MEIKFGEKKYIIKKPNYKELTDAQIYAGKIFNQARDNRCVLRDNLQKYLKEEGLWSSEEEAKLLKITMSLNGIISDLKKGKNGTYKTMTEARKAAIQARALRMDQLVLLNKQRQLDTFTAEAQAENARFDYLASVCILDESNNRVFNNLDEYLEKATEDWAKKCAEELTYCLYPHIDREWENKFPENRFLKKHNLINEKGQLVNKDGHLIDEDFRLINADGQWIDSEGKLVNINGDRIDEDGDTVTEYEEFDNDIE